MRQAITARVLSMEIVTEIKARGFQKALIVTDADLVRFGVVKKVTDLLDENQFAYEIFDQVNGKSQRCRCAGWCGSL